MPGFFHDIIKKLYAAKDPAGLGITRFLFGLLMIIDIFDERGLLLVPEKWGDPDACHFPLFDSLPRLSMEYMHIVYLILLVSASGIMIGFLYRLSCIGFVISYWYLFFMDKTVWNNHSYLYGLLSIVLCFVGGNHYWSVDGLLWPSLRNQSVPCWNYAIIRFQVFLLYFYAGIKKLDKDWVTGYSMNGLSRKWLFGPFRLFLSDDLIDYFIVHLGGLVFDLTQGFLLYFDRTRIIAFIFGYGFHGMNAIMFSIGMFSYMCMALMPIFCRPEWPKNLVKIFPKFIQLFMPLSSPPQKNIMCSEDHERRKKKKGSDGDAWSLSPRKVVTSMMLMFYVSIQLMLPYSHGITKGYNSWTEGLYGYSWDMMIHSWNTQHIVVKVVDKITEKQQYLRPGAFFPLANDRNRIFSHPDMLKQYALCLKDRIVSMPELNFTQPQIYFDVWKSLNDRYQQRMLDPRVDIISAPWSPFEHTSWLRPLLVELTPWRSTLSKIRSVNTEINNATDIVFVADFPGLLLQNYIAPEIIANVSVLSGDVVVETGGKNVSVATNQTLQLKSGETHVIYTVSETPSCYMYVYYNTTWVEQTEEEIIQGDPVLQRRAKAKREWEARSAVEKLTTFLGQKYENYQQGLWQLYLAVSIIFDVGHGENEGVVNEEL